MPENQCKASQTDIPSSSYNNSNTRTLSRALKKHLTGVRYEHIRAAAGEAVKEWFGSDVEVQERGGTAQFGQAEPSPHEPGLIPQEKRDRVPFPEAGHRAQRVRHFIALLLHVLIGESLAFKMNERFSRVFLHRLQKTVHDAVEGSFPLVNVKSDAASESSVYINAVLEKIRAESFEERGEEENQARERSYPHIHVHWRALNSFNYQINYMP